MRHALFLLACAAALVGLARPADACSPPEEGWMLEVVAPYGEQTMAPDDPIVLRGSVFFSIPDQDVRDSFDVEVLDPDGESVSGQISPAPGKDDFFWHADAPLTPGATYTVNVYAIYPWDEQRHLVRTEAVLVGERWLEPVDGGLALDSAHLFEREIHGECLEEEFCGGCFESEVLGHETHWRVVVTVGTPDGSYAAVRTMRSAVGADEDEARTILERTRPFDLGRSGTFDHRIDVGRRDLWPSDSACVAVEVRDPIEGVVLDRVECFAVPQIGDGPLEPEHVPEDQRGPIDPEPPIEPAHDPATDADDADDNAGGGCDASGTSNGASGLWAALLLGGLGLSRRRRRGLWAMLTTALVATGCAPSSPADGEVVPLSPCTENCGPVDPIDPVDPDPLAEAPPPVFGGTMAATAEHAVIGDPDRDRVYIVDLDRQTRVSLDARRPGRVILDEAGETAYVSLRDAGQIQVIDVARGLERTRFEVCPAPRGMALQGARLHVACAGGALLSLNATTGRLERRIALAPDLRDVVVDGEQLHVSRFKQPALYTLDGDGAVLAVRTPRIDDALTDAAPGAPTAAWRTVAMPGGGALMLHQRARLDTVRTETPGGYGDPGGEFTCGRSIVTAEVTAFPTVGDERGDSPATVGMLHGAVLAVDMATTADGLAFAVAGDTSARWQSGEVVVDVRDRDTWGGCWAPDGGRFDPGHQIVAVARSGERPLVFSREPAALSSGGQRIVELSTESVADVGHGLFHRDAGRGIACASCHPEGGEDGHAWLFEGHGLRRTQELRGGIAGSAPFHWVGDMDDMQHLMDEVLTRRMGGPEISPVEADAMLAWIDAQPLDRVEPITGGDPVAGELVFADATVGCAGCHSGPRLTDDRMYDVGTGGLFSTPTLLGIGRRGSMMHDGCGADLRDRFDASCGGGDAHGRTSHLSATELDDLIAYLASL